MQGGRSLAVNHEDMYESLLSRCKEYVSNREEESNPRGTENDHPTSWLVRRLRLDLVWEPETEEEQSAFCKKFDPLALQWEALNLVRAAEPVAAAPGGEGISNTLRWKIPGVVYPQADFASHFGAVEPHAISTALTIDSSSVRVVLLRSPSFLFGELLFARSHRCDPVLLDCVSLVRLHQDPAVPRDVPNSHRRRRRRGLCGRQPAPRVVRRRARTAPPCAGGSFWS